MMWIVPCSDWGEESFVLIVLVIEGGVDGESLVVVEGNEGVGSKGVLLCG